MPVFRLTPVDSTASIWKSSTHCGVFLVRAGDETAARRAAGAYSGFQARREGEPLAPSAHWSDPDVVVAELVEGVADGEAGVITFTGIRYGRLGTLPR